MALATKKEPDYERMSVAEQAKSGLQDSIAHARGEKSLKETVLEAAPRWSPVGPAITEPHGATVQHYACKVEGGTILRMARTHVNGRTGVVAVSDAMVFVPEPA